MINELELKHSDIVQCPANWSWISKNNGWSGFHIWYVQGGEVTIQEGEQLYHLTTGDCFLFDLDKNYICNHKRDNPLHVATAHFHAPYLKRSIVKRWVIHNAQLLGNMLCKCVELLERDRQWAEVWLLPVVNEFLIEQEYKSEYCPAIQKVCHLLENHRQKIYTLEEMCQIAGYSKNQLIRLFRAETGLTPIPFQTRHKIQLAAKLLLYSDKSIAEIALEVGYADVNYFSKVFKKYIGKPPGQYRSTK